MQSANQPAIRIRQDDGATDGMPEPLPPVARLIDRIACLERSIHDRNIFMAATGHDLKQPLQILLHAIEVLAPETRNARENLWFDAAIAQVMRMARGLGELASASLASDDTEWTAIPMPFSLAAVMDEVEAIWSMQAVEKGVRLRFVRCSQMVVSDRRMVTTILNNLVGNAVKHTDYGGVVVGCRLKPGTVQLEVVDTGPGIAERHTETIFRPGERADSTKDGMGIGLALVADLCRRLGTRIHLQTAPGHGSRFSIALPRLR